MCLSISGGANEAGGETTTLNGISSVSDAAYRDDAAYKAALRAARAGSNYVEATHHEGSADHPSMGSAERLEFTDVSYDKSLYSYLTVSGSTQGLNKRDVYSFLVKDRMTMHCKFLQWPSGMSGYVVSEKGEKLLEFADDGEGYGPTALLKKGIYFLYVDSDDPSKADYSVSMGAHYAESGEKVTIDAGFMSKYKALVWESDYVPGAADPIDGTVLKSGSKSRRGSWKYTGGFYSCKTDEEFLYRSIYIWSRDAFDALKSDIDIFEKTTEELLKKYDTIETALNYTSSGTGVVSLAVSFFKPTQILGTPLSVISLSTSFIAMTIGDHAELKEKCAAIKQCERIKGSIESAVDGTVLSIKEGCAIKKYTSGDKYIKCARWELKFQPYITSTGDSYLVTNRRIDQPFPTYNAWMDYGSTEKDEIISDCQGTFTAYKNYNDVKPLIKEQLNEN